MHSSNTESSCYHVMQYQPGASYWQFYTLQKSTVEPLLSSQSGTNCCPISEMSVTKNQALILFLVLQIFVFISLLLTPFLILKFESFSLIWDWKMEVRG